MLLGLRAFRLETKEMCSKAVRIEGWLQKWKKPSLFGIEKTDLS